MENLEPLVDVESDDYSLLGATFGLENDIINAIGWANRKDYEFDFDFDFDDALKQSQVGQRNPAQFSTARNAEEFREIENRILREEAMRERVAGSGAAGIALGIAAGVLSPTILLPAGQIRGAASVGRAAASTASWSAVAVTGQEVVLQANQEIRPLSESAMAVGFGTVLGGLLGGAVKYVSPGESTRLEAHMYTGDDPVYVSPSPEGLSAQVTTTPEFVDPGRLAPGIAGSNKLGFVSPVARTFDQDLSPSARAFQAQLSTGGLRTERVGAAGGDLESIVKQYEGQMHLASREVNKIYQANAAGIRQRLGMGRQAFDEAVGRAASSGGKSDIPGVEEALEVYRERIYRPMFQQARELNMPGFQGLTETSELNYINRVVDFQAATQDIGAFEQILFEHTRDEIRAQYLKQTSRIDAYEETVREAAEDLRTRPEDADARIEGLEQERGQLADNFPEIAQYETEVRRLRAAKQRAETQAEKEAFQRQIDELEKPEETQLRDFRSQSRRLGRRISNVNKSTGKVTEKEARLLDQIDKIEEQQLNSLKSLINQFNKLSARLETLDDAKLIKELDRLQDRIQNEFRLYEKSLERINKLQRKDVGDATTKKAWENEASIEREEALKAKREERAEAAIDRMNDFESQDFDGIRQGLKETQDELLDRVRLLNEKRTIRREHLRARADRLDPEFGVREASRLEQSVKLRRQTVNERFDPAFADDGTPNFDARARERAKELSELLLKENRRLPALSLTGERGSELRRLLNIDETKVWSNGKSYQDFLVRDVNRLASIYSRTVGPDIELMRRFGTVNPLKDDSVIMRSINKDIDDARAKASEIKDKKKRERELTKITKQKAQIIKDLEVQIERLRNVRGIPQDPASGFYRAGKAMRDINTMRLMGTVLPSSLGDVGRPVLKFGMLETFGGAARLMFGGLQNMQMSARFAQEAGVATDLSNNARMAALFDIADDTQHNNSLERGLHWGASNIGRIGLFNYWNLGMKTLTSNIAMVQLSRIVDKTARGVALSGSETRMLNSANLDNDSLRMIVKEFGGEGNFEQVNGVWLPNAERWANQDAKRAMRAALARLVDDTIITPGLERSNWLDGSEFGRLVGQFRSFTLSSTTKATMAIGQDIRAGEIRILPGVISALAFGSLSYYTYSMSRGGKSKSEMQNASWEKWADEAIARSGVLGVLAEIHRNGSAIEGLRNYTTLSGDAVARGYWSGEFLRDSVGGPSLSLLEDVGKVVSDNVTAFDQQTANSVRRLMPYNNVFFLSQAFSAMAEAGAN